MPKETKFRKDMTPEQYKAYLEKMAKTDKFEHDGIDEHLRREYGDKFYKTKKKVG